METYTGLEVNPLDLRPEDIRIEDIAHSLSLLCRYGGHCKTFYSVAQHSLHVAVVISERFPLVRLFGLLHDAAETYLGDMITPLKERIPAFRKYENEIMVRILSKFCPRPPTPLEWIRVKRADARVLLGEAFFLMPSRGEGWREDTIPAGLNAEPVIARATPKEAETLFLNQFLNLRQEATSGRNRCKHPGCRSHWSHPCEVCGHQWNQSLAFEEKK